MTISVDDAQLTLAARASVKQIALLRMETYSDLPAGTVDEVLYFASAGIQYPWDGATVNYWAPGLVDVSDIEQGFSHIPDAAVLDTRRAVEFELDATDEVVWQPFDHIPDKQLLGAKVEIASLLVDDMESDDWRDLSSLGAVHVVRFRGEVTQIADYDHESLRIRLIAETIEPALSWPKANDPATVDPRDLGKRYPIPVGSAKGVPLINREVGATTTLISNLTASATGPVEGTDFSAFPNSGSFRMVIGEEVVIASKTSSRFVNVTARAQMGTTGQPHGIGSTIIEMTEDIRFVCSHKGCKAINALYLLAPSGQRTYVTTARYSFAPIHEGIDGSGEDNRVAMVAFDREQFLRMLEEMGQEVTQQPSVSASVSGVETVQVPFTSWGEATEASDAVSSEATVLTSDGTAQGVRLNYKSSAPNDDESGVFYCTSAGVPNQSRTVSRFRVVFDLRIESGASATTRLEYKLYDLLNTTQAAAVLTTLAAGPQESRTKVATGWFSPSSTTLADLGNSNGSPLTGGPRVAFFLEQSGGGDSAAATEAFVYAPTSYVEVELEPLTPTLSENPVEVGGGVKYGNGVQLVADLEGVTDDAAAADFPELDFTTTTGWTAHNCTLSLGSGSSLQPNTPTATDMRIEWALGTPVDLSSEPSITFEALCPLGNKEDMASISNYSFFVRLDSGSGNYTDYGFGPAQLVSSVWTKVGFDLESPFVSNDGGSGVNLASVTSIHFGVNWDAGAIPGSGAEPSWSVRNCQTQVRTTVESQADVAQWVIEKLAGLPSAAVDSTTFSAAETNVPFNGLSGDLRAAGETLAALLAVIGFNSRTNFVAVEGSTRTVYKAYAASSSYAFTPGDFFGQDPRRQRVISKTLEEQPTEFSAVYDAQFYRGVDAIEAYAGFLRADATVNDISSDVPTVDITAAQARVGVRASEVQAFPFIDSESRAIEVWAYYVHEALRGQSLRFALWVPSWDGYAAEIGDVIQYVPPFGFTKTCRIVRTSFSLFAPGLVVTLEEVE